jgi:hypothetical protein
VTIDLARTAVEADDPLGYVFLGLMFLVSVGGITLAVIRMRRGLRPRDEQMRRLAAMLDGRGVVAVRMAEIGLDASDLALVAHSRGYLVVPHTVMKYYEFVYAPHRIPAYGRPWQR